MALGPELPPFYCDDDAFAARSPAPRRAVGDPVWRLPLTTPYESWLDSDDGRHEQRRRGRICGLRRRRPSSCKRFVRRARLFAHFDIYGWRPAPRPLGPKGGEPQAARAVFETLRRLTEPGT